MRIFGLIAAALVIATLTFASAAQEVSWSVPPAYETDIPVTETDLSFTNSDGDEVTLYSESHAVLILQGAYQAGGPWSPAIAGAETSERLLVNALEARRFHVLVWKDLGSDNLETVIKEVAANFSDSPNARLFFYYFGHGVARDAVDNSGPRFYLVPVDAPAAEDRAFVSKAMSGLTLLARFDALGVKHAFFAFEACRSGGILGSLSRIPGRNAAGYLTSDAARAVARQYLTAGTELQDIPANAAFSATLVGALSSPDADTNGDNYITGTEATAYVVNSLPTFPSGGIYTQSPEHRRDPAGSIGDFIFGPHDPTNFSPYLAPDIASPDFQPSLAEAFAAMEEKKYETAERHIRPFAENGSPEGIFAMAALEAERNPTPKGVLPLIARAAMLGQEEAQRIIGVLRQSKDGKLELDGEWIAQEGDGFFQEELIEELTRLDTEYAELAAVSLDSLASGGDPYALMALHRSDFFQKMQQYYAEDDENSPLPKEEATVWLERAALEGYAPAKVQLVLARLGVEYSPWDYDVPLPEGVSHEDVALLTEAAEGGYGRAAYLLSRWRLQLASPLPGLSDDKLVKLAGDAIELAALDPQNPISASDFFHVDGAPVPRQDQLYADAELFISLDPPLLDLAESRLAELSAEIADMEWAQSYYARAYGRLFEARGDLAEAFEKYASAEETAGVKLEDLLRVGSALGLDENRYSRIEEAIGEVYCVDEDCSLIAKLFIDLADIRLAQKFAGTLRSLTDETGQFSEERQTGGRIYDAYAAITTFVIEQDGGNGDNGLSAEDLRPFFVRAAQRGHAVAANWLQARGFEAPIPEDRVSGEWHDNWQFVRFYTRDRGVNCYVTSDKALRLGNATPDRNPNLIVYTFGESPKVGLLQYNAETPVDPDGEVVARWDIGDVVPGRPSNAPDGRLIFAGHDPEVIRAMAQGKVVTIEYVTEGGDTVADTYSLFGFTAAYRDMVDGCPNMSSAL